MCCRFLVIASVLPMLMGFLPRLETLTSEEVLEGAQAAFNRGVAATDDAERAGEFHWAAMCYRDLVARRIRNPRLFENLGNCYVLTGDLPRAIQAYKEGLRLAPHDAALHDHLSFARSQVVYAPGIDLGRQPAEIWLRGVLRRHSGWLLALGFFFYVLAWGLWTRWWMFGQRWLLASGAAAMAVALILSNGLRMNEIRNQRDAKATQVIINRDDVHLRKGNGVAYPYRFDQPLNRGVESRVLFQKEGWLKIELAGGETGWVHERDVLWPPAGGP